MSVTRTGTCALLLLLASPAGCTDDGTGPGEDTEVDTEDGQDTAEEDGVEDVAEEDTGEEVPDEPDPLWEAFLENREDYLVELSAPILDCVARSETTHPAFHGCIDWHSAVEGVYALLALTRVTSDPSYAAAADAILTPANVAAELAVLESGGPVPTEIPYGYSWFLVLALERELDGDTDLVPLAEIVAPALETHLGSLSTTDIGVNLTNDDYRNISWEVLNLHQWAVHTADWDLVTWIEDFTRVEILSREFLCPLSHTPTHVYDFFPPCLHRARALVMILPPDEVSTWLETNLPPDFDLDPLTTFDNIHIAGLNFSRTWGLWALWEATGQRKFRTMYVEHIDTHMAMPAYWREDYMYSHWIPNFGVYSILLSY